MSNRIAQVLMIFSIATLAVGCSSPPTDRAEAARARLEALGSEARTHAPEAFAEAQDAAAQLEAELEAQSQEFAFSRSYDRADQLIAEVNAAADRVETAIETGRREAAAEAAEAEEARRAEAEAAEAAAAEEAAAMEEEAASPSVRPGEVALPRAAMADGQRLAPGVYGLRLGDEAPAKDATMRAGRWVEFVSNGAVSGRAIAVVIPDAEIGEVAASSYPRNEAWVAELQGGEYVRVWLNRGGMHYLLHLPTS